MKIWDHFKNVDPVGLWFLLLAELNVEGHGK